jgi:hypothetical protein
VLDQRVDILPNEDFNRAFVVMEAETERALSCEIDLLDNVIAVCGEDKAGGHAATHHPLERNFPEVTGVKSGMLIAFPLGTPATLSLLFNGRYSRSLPSI